ncbi:MAG: DUF2169 domain-containing protein [Pseudomonadales bacterium]|nr:DUF2169 domain-containing protein [Pseudomonadales bacterium]
MKSDAMDVINKSGLLYAPLVGRIGFPGHSLTFIVKGTFDLNPNGKALLSEKQLFPTGNELYEDDNEGLGSSRYESDFAHFKPRADLLLVGKCHSPGNKAVQKCRASFHVGDISKSLDITGNRYKQGIFKTNTTAEFFTELELRYENSYGGISYKKNPVGKGDEKEEKESDSTLWPLANINHTQSCSEPAGFGPLGSTWKDRASKMGKYKGAWLKDRWPWFPEDFDWAYFNAAPPDMQVDGYLRGDESLYFENLHSSHSQYRSQLPGIRIRLFIHVQDDKSLNDTQFKEVELNLDTLWVDMEAEKLALVWRGVSAVQSEDYEEIQHLFICSEKLDEAPESIDYYHKYFLKELDEDDEEDSDEEPVPDDDIDVDAEIAKAEAQMRASLVEAGIDPDTLPGPTPEQKAEEAKLLSELGIELGSDPLTAEIFSERFERGESFSDENLQGLDLSGLEIRGVNLQSAILSGACFRGSNLAGAMLSEADLSYADLSHANLQGVNLKDADLSGANLNGADLSAALLDDAIFEKATLQGCILEGVSALAANFSEANLSQARLAKSVLREADFSKSILMQADFHGADLSNASVEGALGREVNMAEADLTELRASSGCDFSYGNFTKIQGKESIWENAILVYADFSYAKMEGADFTSANLTSANLRAANMKFSRFSKANLEAAELIQINLFQGSLEKAYLKKTNFKGANLYGVEFLDAILEDANFNFANLKSTKLS